MAWLRNRQLLIWFCLIILLCTGGCVEQNAHLDYAPASDAPVVYRSADVTMQPLATPAVLMADIIQGSLFDSDNAGVPIADPESHYFKYYVSFSELRVFEEDEHCYLDGLCNNGYDRSLKGKCEIVFYDQEGRMCGSGSLHTADSQSYMTLSPGDNRIYAEVSSEIDVTSYPFEIVNNEPFLTED